MRPRLNLSLRRALMAAMTVATTLVSPVYGGVVDSRYDLQYYMDFCRNKGMFAAGATNIEVYYKDGTHIDNNVIPLMPNMDSYGQTVTEIISIPGLVSQFSSNGGTNLVSAQFLYGAKHVQLKVGNTPVAFLSENAVPTCVYSSANLDTFGTDSAMQRLTKLVTAVAYTPLADDAFMSTLKLNETWLYRTGNGGKWCEGKPIQTGDNALGGVVNLSTCWQDSNGEWYLEGWTRTSDTSSDTRTPLDVGVYLGDSGSPYFAWDDTNNRFVFVGALFASNTHTTFPSWHIARYNYQQASAVMDKYFVSASFSGSDTIVWSASDAVSGKGTLTQNGVTVEYTGKGSGNTLADSLGLMFSSESSETQVLQLQGNVNMGAGALTFESGQWRLTEQENADYSLTGAGFEIKKGAEVTWELTGSSSQEIRKVGEGVLTISGSGNNESSLVVGGGSTVYNVVRDDAGNIIGCTLGNAGETRLNRENGYAASSVRLEGGVAIIVLMADNQFKTNSVQGDTFSFGNDGGLLNLNGHDLTWGVINQDGSGTGARIGNYTPEGMETTPSTATFTYTGTGTFAGCFMDEGPDKAQLKVAYNHASGGQWTLTGQHSNAGGFVVQAGTMALQGSLTPHVNMSDGHDWTYATLESSGGVTIENGATFRLSHHALMSADVTVNQGATFLVNHTANAVSESISGSGRMDMRGDSGYGLLTSFKGNVALSGSMVVDTGSSPVMTSMQGNITGTGTLTKRGSGNYFVDGAVNISSGTVEAGGLIIRCNLEQFGGSWTIKEQGYLGVEGVNGADLLRFVSTDSSGVLALVADQTEALDLSSHQNLYIGALGTLNYGSADKTLAANENKQWLLGGGGGTLNVLFRLTGENDLIIGNDYSGGTVHLSNIDNDFTGDIYIKGTGNILTYATDTETGNTALGTARVALSYGNTLGLNAPSQLSVLREGAQGVLALTKDMSLDLTGKPLSVGAAGALTLTSELTVGDVYRFGGQGDLTIDTNLASAAAMELDGQGNSGSSVTFVRNDAFSGVITAGGGLHLEDANSSGDIGIHVSNEYALAVAKAIELQKGATLYTDGGNLVLHNLSATTGSAIKNNGTTASMLQLNIDEGVSATIENGVLSNTYFVNDAGDDVLANLHIVKTGKGTVSMGGNTSWSGGLTIMEGQVNASLANGGIGAAGSAIYVTDGASLQLTSGQHNYRNLASTILPQKLSGDGEVSISNGNDMLFMTQAAGFEGTVKVTGNTRLYVTMSAQLSSNAADKYSTSQAFDRATIVVESGSQARLTPSIYCLSGTTVQSWADYVISGGADFLGNSSGLVQSKDNGALVVDGLATVWGNVTLADDAMIASWSHDPRESQNVPGSSFAYQCVANSSTNGNYYGIINKLGGIIRGQILGEVEEDGTMTDLTIGGTEGITITADSANTFEDLIIANGNSKNYNSDLIFALRLDGGEAISQTSTALGTGTVTLNDGLILRLAGTGASNSDIVYTYENAINAGDGATLQSYYITNRLTGTVTMQGDELNLATANGGVLELVGGISGSGTLNVAAGSKVILGSAAAGYALARTGGAAFSGTVATAAGSDITLASPAVVADNTIFSGKNALTLRFAGTEDYTLNSIVLSSSAEVESTELSLHFDFTDTRISAGDESTYNTLTVENMTADKTIITIDMNMFEVLSAGTYTLINGFSGIFSLANNTSDNRLGLALSDDGHLVLMVTEDDTRMYWSGQSASQAWNVQDANWQKGGKTVVYTEGTSVVFDAAGVEASNAASSRETISLNSANLTVNEVNVLDAYYEINGSYALNGTSLGIASHGDLKLSANASFENSVVAQGSLTVSGSTFTLTKDGTAGVLVADIGASVLLEQGATLSGHVTIKDDADVHIRQSSLEGNVTLDGTGYLSLDAAVLNGEIEMGTEGRIIAGSFDGTTASYAPASLSGKLVRGSGSSLTLTDGTVTMDGAVNLDAFTISAGKQATLWNATAVIGKQKVFGTLSLGEGATLEVNNRQSTTSDSADIGTLVVDSTATIKEVYDAGHLKIATLQLADGVDSATLTITKDSKNKNSAYTSVFDLGSATAEAGNFAGKVVLNNTNSSSNNHSVFINLYNKDILAHTVVSMGTQVSGRGLLGLGISVDNVQIAGLETQNDYGSRVLVFSGVAPTDKGWNVGDNNDDMGNDGIVRTLTINTANNEAYTYTGQFRGNVNLVKSGQGTQRFYGSSSAFNGSINIEAGTLAFNAAGSSMLSGASGMTLADGATLDLSSITFGNGSDTTNTITLASGAEFCFDADAHIAFGQMKSGVTYHVFDASNGSLRGWDANTLGIDNFTVDGVALSEYGRTVWLELGALGTFTFNVEVNNLVWTGATEHGTWDTAEDNTSWTQIIGDLLSTESTYFVNHDNAIFISDASVTVADAVRTNMLTVKNHATVTLDGTLHADKVTIESGSKLKATWASVLTPVKAFDIAAGAELEIHFPGTPSYTSEVSGDGTITLTGGGTMTWNPSDSSLDMGTLSIKANTTFQTSSAFSADVVDVVSGVAKFNGTADVGSFIVASGSTLEFAAKTTSVSTSLGSNITGGGIVKWNLCNTDNAHWGNKITMSDGFTGEVHLNAARMTLDGSTTGSKLVLLTDAANIQLTTSSSSTSWNGNLELRATHVLHSNSGTDFTFAGDVTGTGTYKKESTGTLTFGADGRVNLGKFYQTGGNTTFAGSTTLSALESRGGTVEFRGSTQISGAAQATTLNVSGGAMKVNFTSANEATITDNANGSFTVGTLNYTGGTLEMSGTVNITTLKIGGGLTATVYNNGATAGQNKTFGTVELGNGAILQTYDNARVTKATDLGTLKLMSDSATIQDAWHAGYYHVDALTMGAGVTSSTLNLKKTASSSLATVFELGNADDTTSNFAGTINLNQTNTGKGRSAFVVLSNANIAQNAVISMTDASDTTESAYIGLGINADNATIAGLESKQSNGSIAKLFSGKIGTEVEWTAKSGKTTPPSTVGDAIRTLNITTKAGGEHEFYGEVLGSLNLVIDGEGTQKFLGTSNSFSGSVMVQGGTAAFNDAGLSLLEHATAFSLTDGVLDVSAISFGEDATHAISLNDGVEFSFGAGGTIALGDLQADTVYKLFDIGTGSLSGWNTETLSLANFTLAGQSMTHIDGATLSLGADGTFSYTQILRDADTLYWSNAAGDYVWSVSTKNWHTESDLTSGETLDFNNADSVVFGSTASVTVQGTLQAASLSVADAATVTLTLDDGAELTLDAATLGRASSLSVNAAADTMVTISNISGGGNLVKTGSGTLELGDAELHTLDFTHNNDSYAQAVGELHITGTVNIADTLRVGDGTLTIGEDAAVTTKVFQAVSNGKNANSRIEINGGSLTITGTDDVDGETTDFILGYWHNSNTTYAQLQLSSGTLTAENTSLYMGFDSPGVFKAMGGEATLKGIRFRNNEADADTFELGTATSANDSVTVTIGSTGIVGMASNDVIKLGGGTLKASADFAITAQSGATPSVSLIGTTAGTIFDTNTHNVTVNTALTGSGKLVKNSMGNLIFTAANTYTGETTINAGSIVLNLGSITNDAGETENRTYTLGGKVSGNGTLEVAEGTTLANNSKKIDAALVLNGGNASITGGSTLSGDVTIKNGSTLIVGTSNGSDHFDYNDGHTVIVEEGGTLALGSNRETFGTWVLDVQGGLVTGTGATGDVGTAALDYHQSKTISASVGNGEIAAAVGVRSDKTVTFDVASGASLAISSAIVGQGHIAKATGTGDLIFTADNTYTGTTTISAGTLELQGSGQVGKGDVSIAAGGAALTAATTATQDAESEVWASITSTSATAAADINGARLVQTEATKTLSLTSRTQGEQGRLNNSLITIAQGASLTVQNMLIAESSRIQGAGAVATYAARDASTPATPTVTYVNSTIELGSGNAALTGQAATLGSDMSLTSTGGSQALTLAAGSKMLTMTTNAMSNLTVAGGSSLHLAMDYDALFADLAGGLREIDVLKVVFADDTVNFADLATTTITGSVGDYRLTAYYMAPAETAVAHVGTAIYFDVRAVPEPSTTTLGVLALAGLMLRRRRK